MVTPENGTLTFKGVSGRLYTIDAYISDVVAAPFTMNPNGAAVAGSSQYWRCPESVTLVDYSIATGNTVSVGAYFTRDGATIPGSSVRSANQLNTLAFRPALKIDFPAGCLIGAIQF